MLVTVFLVSAARRLIGLPTLAHRNRDATQPAPQGRIINYTRRACSGEHFFKVPVVFSPNSVKCRRICLPAITTERQPCGSTGRNPIYIIDGRRFWISVGVLCLMNAIVKAISCVLALINENFHSWSLSLCPGTKFPQTINISCHILCKVQRNDKCQSFWCRLIPFLMPAITLG
jgi:hypothetical protein